MNSKIQKVLEIWHKHFEDEQRQYSEFESSYIEYFVSCLLYNHFSFEKALDTMKTIDLSYDFISACGDEYDEILSIIKTIEIDDEGQKIKFLQDFIKDSQAKYSDDELYLLNRMQYHVNAIFERYESGEEAKRVEFVAPKKKSANPLLR